jgi:hypothetical protein
MLGRAAPAEEVISPDWPQVAQLTDLTDAICRQALAAAARSEAVVHSPAVLLALLARPEFVYQLTQALATGLAQVLGQHDPRIVAVYGYQPEPPPAGTQPPAEPAVVAIHLLIAVTAPSAALQVFVDALERSLAASLCALPGYRQWPRAFVLDANIMTQEAFQGGLGLARFISAGPAEPVRLWAGAA